jgi:hypothetical protein
MIPRLLARCLGTAFQVVVEGSGGRGGRVELQSCDDSAAVYEARW